MKSIFKFGAVAALTLFAASCAKEQIVSENETVETSFAVELPGGAMSTKGLSDASEINELVCQVFTINSDKSLNPITDLFKTVDVVDCKAKVSFSLVKGQKYTFAFWAQAAGTGYYDTTDLRAVKMNVANVKANDPKMDAYFGIKEGKIIGASSTSEPLTLYRAVGQVNFGAEDLDRADALEVVKSKITLTDVPTVFNAAAGNKDNAYSKPAEVLFAVNPVVDERLLVSDKEYNYLATCYVFAPKDQILTDAEAVFYLSNGKDRSAKAPNAPIKRNARTNILGNLLTVNTDWNITIDSKFQGGDFIYDAVSANLEKGGNVTLENNYSVASKSVGVVVPLGVTSTLNLNGKRFANENGSTANKAALQVRGNLTIDGDGEVYCEGGAVNNAIIVEQGGKLVISGGTYNVGKASNNGTSNATIYVQGPDTYGRTGTVKIYGGTFSAEEGSDGTTPFVLNQSDDITDQCIFVYGGTFIGFNPGDNTADGPHTNYLADGYRSVETTVDGKQAWTVEAMPATGTQEDFNDAITSATDGVATVVMAANTTFTLKNGIANSNNGDSNSRDITVIGNGTQTFDVITESVSAEGGKLNYQRGSSFTVKNVTVQCGEGSFDGIVCDEITLVNCTIKGKLTLYGKANFINCVFENTMANQYSIWTWGGTDVNIKGCTFNTNGKAVLLYGQATAAKPTNLTVTNCTFNDRNSGSAGKAAIEIGNDYKATYNLVVSGCTVNGFAQGENTGSTLWANKNSMDAAHLSVTIDGDKAF